ncbi:MAG: hypothetical protein ACI9SJ_001546 [Flavobacteriaceae bacterium]|jgi:hypothetical protein|uniref:DUF2851 family protein n=1 Tax=Candidatus Marifrigoribacter sp. Uisw_064 TaxID=3230970 RepID=UPI003AE04B85
MKEDFLHYVWTYQKFSTLDLFTSNKEIVQIIKTGAHNFNAGPDFLHAQVIINELVWIGHVEVHINSSDWYAHHHEQDPQYDNVVLHVVWNHDTDVFRKDNTLIPTLELKEIVDINLINNYQNLLLAKNGINCKNEIATIDTFIISNWLDSLYLERLEQKSKFILNELINSNNNWEALLFTLLSKNFGLKVNGESFFSIAKSIPFSTLKKCSKNALELEALLLGQAGLLEKDVNELYYFELQRNYSFLKSKFKLSNSTVVKSIFFRLRPPNFPTIRLSQLAVLYTLKQNLFSEIIHAKTLEEFYAIFLVTANPYWDMHYNFKVTSKKRKKGITKKFVDLLLINTIIPLKYCYTKYLGKDISEEIIELVTSISKEGNITIKEFEGYKVEVKNSLESQAIIQLKNEYCIKNRCLHCAIGFQLLKR